MTSGIAVTVLAKRSSQSCEWSPVSIETKTLMLQPDAVLIDQRDALLDDAVGLEPLNAFPARRRGQADPGADFGHRQRSVFLQNGKDFPIYGIHEMIFFQI